MTLRRVGGAASAIAAVRLIAIGTIGAAVLVGGGWLALGIGLWVWPASVASPPGAPREG